MKRLLFLLSISLIVSSCTQEATEKTKSPEELQYEKDLYLIGQMGYDISEIRKMKDGYVVEGDIWLTKRHIEDFEKLPRTRQTFNVDGLIVSKENQHITVNYMFSHIDYHNAAYNAIEYWNKKSQCNVVLTGSGGNCIMDVRDEPFYTGEGLEDYNTLMLVTPPTSAGEPGSIKINSNCVYHPKPDTELAKYMILHAIGHALGYGHTPRDYTDQRDDPETDKWGLIEGTEGFDSKSIMVREGKTLSWNGFSENDIKAFKAKYPKEGQNPEPEPEPEPKPDFSTAVWKEGNDLGIRFKGNDIDDTSRIHFPTYVELTGAGWSRYQNAQKFVRILDAEGKVVEKGNSANRYTFPSGSYTLQYGACVVNASGNSTCYYGQTSFRVWHSQPSLWTSVLDEANVDLAHTYVIRTQYETYIPEWQNYTNTITMTEAATGEEIELRYSSVSDLWRFEFPARGTYEIVWTLTNGSGQTKTVEKTLHITSPDAAPVYYKLFEEFVGPDHNRQALSRFYLQFYSDSKCTQQITSTTATIELSYILWKHYYDRYFQLASSSKWREGTLLVPVGSSRFYLPHTVSNATNYTLDQYVFEYEITFLSYK